jgi:2-polyprenyl-6-methoxyphenol hydroxylase-like FAD-dependent oxidoreductase
VRFTQGDGIEHEESARLVVGADGRSSAVRAWAGFETRRAAERRLFAGILFENVSAPEDVLHQGFLFGTGLMTYVFPLGKGRARCYVGFQNDTGVERFQGAKDVARFVETALEIGVPQRWYADARPAGPLATFDATDEWVESPYRDGVVLVGDAAATSDPTWGQGMSITLRDLRLLRDRLLETDDWHAAARAYAADHDAFFAHVRRADTWFTDLFLDVGPHADALRARALPPLLADPTRLLDTPLSGPEVAATEAARRRFHGQDDGGGSGGNGGAGGASEDDVEAST